MKFFLRLLKSTVFVTWLLATMLTVTVTASLWALHLTTQVATLTAVSAATALAHRKDIARAVAKVKAKARLRRLLMAAPFVGLGAIVYFEEQDFREWKLQNPEGTREEYSCEVAELTAEVIDEVLQDLPPRVRPSPNALQKFVPDCELQVIL